MIKFNDLSKQWDTIKDKCLSKIHNCLQNGSYILGPQVQEFENNFAKYIGTKYAIGVSSGTDAITLSIISILDLYTQPDQKGLIIIQNNTYIATLLSIYHAKNNHNFDVGLVDCDAYYQINTLELQNLLLQYRNKYDYCVIIPVHMYGHCANMKSITKIAQKYNCIILEDSSQSHGTITEENKKTGTYGLVNVFSLYPGKNLGAVGDAGIITTDDQRIKDYLYSLRNQGSNQKYIHDTLGFNNRLDSIQAIVLNEKLKFLDEWNFQRNKIVTIYNKLINKYIIKPQTSYYCNYNTYHIYPVLINNRKKFIQHLSDYDIPTLIHYPITIVNQLCCKNIDFVTISNLNNSISISGHIVSLPIHPFLTQSEVEYVCKIINEYQNVNN